MSKTDSTPYIFYDIECFHNVFTLCNLHSVKNKSDWLDIYILCKDTKIVGSYNEQKAFRDEITDAVWYRIMEKNKSFCGGMTFFDLRNPAHNLHLINTFGANDSNNYKTNSFAILDGYKNFIRDTDADYNESEQPYIFGYNSVNYDSTMLALYFNEVHNLTAKSKQPSAGVDPAVMRKYNDEMFENHKDAMPDYLKSNGGTNSRSFLIRQNMIRSGRHIDVARLNEKQQHIGLKRVLGMMGEQILESDKLMTGQAVINSFDELADLLAYNVSDVIGLRKVFVHKTYNGSFELKKGLLNSYPELIYKQAAALDVNNETIHEAVLDSNGNQVYQNVQIPDPSWKPSFPGEIQQTVTVQKPLTQQKLLYKPHVTPENVRYDRLYIDSSSAQLAAKTLCPYGQLTDIPVVSYMYPSERQAKELGIPRVNVLEECNKFFNNLYNDKPDILAEWQRIYHYYRFIENKNFNSSNHQLEVYPGISVYDSKVDMPSKNMVCDSNYNKSDEYIVDGEIILQKTYVPTNYKIKELYAGFFDILTGVDDNSIENSSGYHMRPNDTNVYDAVGNVTDVLIYDKTDGKIFKKEYKPTNCHIQGACICDEIGTPTGFYAFDGNTTLEYYDNDGKTTGCYVLFGIGGIHGAEYNKSLFDAEMQEYLEIKSVFDECKRRYPDPLLLKQKPSNAPRGWKWSIDINGKNYDSTFFLKSGSTSKKAKWKDISKLKPKLFKEGVKKAFALNPKYTRTSAENCNHEDFTSYYPNMLRMMDAFFNEGLGYDRYAEIFFQKEKYGKLMKDKSIPPEERSQYDVLRNGTKLILNSASGAADARFTTPIQANNQIMSMRIIGQLFTWRIGQAQSYQGARVVSTNTDGLFTVLEAELNNQILAKEAKDIHVAIEPEPCFLVSKDSNNRLEENSKKIVYSSAGGSLGCYDGPDLTKSLAHPAMIDRILGDYLRNANNCHADSNYLENPFNDNIGRQLLDNAKSTMPPVRYLLMMQHITASSPGTHTFVFGEEINNPNSPKHILQHYNRVFYVKPHVDLPNTYHLRNAVARSVTSASKLARKKAGQKEIIHDLDALKILEQYGVSISQIPYGKEASFKKVSGIDETWACHIENRSLFELTDEELTVIIDALEIENYLKLLRDNFEKNWRNLIGNEIKKTSDKYSDEDDENIDKT